VFTIKSEVLLSEVISLNRGPLKGWVELCISSASLGEPSQEAGMQAEGWLHKHPSGCALLGSQAVKTR